MIIKLEGFMGIAPAIDPKLLPERAGQTASNCLLHSGALRPIKSSTFVSSTVKAGAKSIFRYLGQYWFSFTTDASVVMGPVDDDTNRRVYWTGDGGAPKMSISSLQTGPAYPTSSYLLGLPAPASAPTATVDGTADPDPPTTGTEESRAYVYTYVSAYGEEGPPSPPSNIVTWGPGQHVDLTSLSVAPAGSYNVTQKRIYRVNTGSEGSEYQYVGSTAVANTSFADTVASASLGDALITTDWDAPPSDLEGLIALPSGCLAGYAGNRVCFSELYQPHAWPVDYRIILDGTINGMAAYGNTVLVTTDKSQYVITGQDPSSMLKERLEEGETCISTQGMVDMGYSVVYPSSRGLVFAGPQNVSLITGKLISQSEWANFTPASFRAYLWEGKWLGFWYTSSSVKGGLIFDPATGDITTTTSYATAGWYDHSNGKTYLVINGEITEWNTGSSYLTYTWKSKKFLVERPTNFGACQVFADSYSALTVKVYADGVLKHTQTVTSEEPFRLPSGFRARVWEVEITGTDNVSRVYLATTMNELAVA